MPTNMERFTQRARRVLSLAQAEAERMQHGGIGPEHVLLGLMQEEGGVAGRVMRDLGILPVHLERLVTRLSDVPRAAQPARMDLAASTKRTLELAVDEARRMGHHYIGTEHLLLGLVRLTEGAHLAVLRELKITPDDIRRQTRRVLAEAPYTRSSRVGQPLPVAYPPAFPPSPAPGDPLAHVLLAKYLLELLDAYFALNPIGRVLPRSFVMRLRSTGTPQMPDLQVILKDSLGQLTDTMLDGPAAVCIEIVSPDSARRDYGDKLIEYEAGLVKEYWIIDPLRQRSQFNRLNESVVYAAIHPDDQGFYRTPLLPGLALHVPTLWQETLPNVVEIVQAVQAMLSAE